VPRVAQGSRVDFLSGLVTIDSGMIALIDLSHILTVSVAEGRDRRRRNAGSLQSRVLPSRGDEA
jgi:hypothetical protein